MTTIALFEEWRRSGREVAVVGLGKSGVAATLLLRSSAFRSTPRTPGRAAVRRLARARCRPRARRWIWAATICARIGRAAAVVVAPGVPPGVPPLAAAREAGLAIYAEVDIGFLALDGTRCIGITGTNGKTTTTSLIAHVLSAGGSTAESAGNIGRPLCDVALAADRPDWLALELSSFQLHDAPHLRPAIGVLTNLAPNHLDRYHYARGVLWRQGAALPKRRRRLRVGEQRRRPRRAGDGGAGGRHSPAVLDRRRAPTDGSTAPEAA